MALSRADALRLRVDVDATKAKQDLDSFAQKTESTGKRAAAGTDKAEKSFMSLRGAMLKVGLATAAVSAAYVVIDRFAKKAQEIEGVSKGFDVLTKRIGQSSDAMLQRMRPAARGLISDMELMKQANNGIILGLPVTADSMGKLTDAAVKLGTAMGVTADVALESLIVGIGRQSKLWLDNIGIVVDADAAYKKMADSLGVQVGELTEAQRKMAFYNETVKKATEASQGLSVEVNTLSGYWQAATTALSNYLDKAIALVNLLPQLEMVGGVFVPGGNFSVPAPRVEQGGDILPESQAGVPQYVQDMYAELERLRLKAVETANALFAIRTGAAVTPGGSDPVGTGNSPGYDASGTVWDMIIPEDDEKLSQYQQYLKLLDEHAEKLYKYEDAVASALPMTQAFTSSLLDHVDALIQGQESAGDALKGIVADVLRALAAEAAGKAAFELAAGFASLAIRDTSGAKDHFTAAAIFGSAAVVAGAGASLLGGSGGGGHRGGGGSGRSASSSVASTGSPASSNRNQEVTVIIEGNGVIYGSVDDLARLISGAVNQQNSRAGV